jgi:hypothetical protein
MGLCKNLYTKIGEGSFISADEKRFGAYRGMSPIKKKKVAPDKQAAKDMFLRDLLDELL